MLMKRWLCVCIALVMMLSFIPAVHAQQVQKEVTPALMGELDGTLSLHGSTDVAYTNKIGSTGNTNLSLYLPLADNEKMIVSYEFYDYSKKKWEPRDVRIVHGPASGFFGTLESEFEQGEFRVAVSTTSENPKSAFYHAEFVAW